MFLSCIILGGSSSLVDTDEVEVRLLCSMIDFLFVVSECLHDVIIIRLEDALIFLSISLFLPYRRGATVRYRLTENASLLEVS